MWKHRPGPLCAVPLRIQDATSLRCPTSAHAGRHQRRGTFAHVGEPPKINPRAADPPYRQIAAWLRARIEAGEFRPGEDPLPSEKDLQEFFEVSRDTARRAVAVLREEGLVVTVPQRGTYVRER